MSEYDLAAAVLTIDLAAITANWRKLRRMVAPAECSAVVKADGYGLGADEIAPLLEEAGCRLFYVAQLGEALALRKVLPTAEIAVFEGVVAGAEGEFAQNRLIPVLNSIEQIDRWGAVARGWNELPAILHVDTGLNRLGLPAAEVARLAEFPERLSGIRLRTIISHLACSDDPDDPMNAEQLETFRRLRAQLPSARAGIAASGGIFLGAPFHLDQVRPGIAIYGAGPFTGEASPMAQVIELHAQILQVRDVDSPGAVGYGATYRVRRPSRIATVGVGYADGYFRALSHLGGGYIGDHLAPLVGRISMDLITLDVTDVPHDRIEPGVQVELIGPHRTVDEIAADAKTVGYEILTSIGMSKRIRRRYLGGERRA